MRVKIDFYINKNIKFQKSLTEGMTAFIYKILNIEAIGNGQAGI